MQQVNYNSYVISGGYESSSAADTNWHRYTATIIPQITTNNFAFGIDCRPAMNDFYVDDVALIAEGSTSNLVADPGFETAYQSNFNGDGSGWPTANWVDLRWMSEYAWQVHQYGNPNGPKALYIEKTTVPVVPPPPLVVSATLRVTGTGVTVVYSVPVAGSTAVNVTNYALNNGGTISGASINVERTTVVLTTSPLSNSATNILTINNVQEETGVSTIASNTQFRVTSLSVRVAAHNGAPTILVDDSPLTEAGYSNYGVDWGYITNFTRVGTRLFDFHSTASAWDGGNVPTTWTAPTTWDYSNFDQSFSLILSANSNALIIPRIYIGTPTWWLTNHPSEWEITENGTTYYTNSNGIRPMSGPFPSLASTLWRQEMGDAIDRLIDHIEAKGWINHVVGFKISGLMTEEWYHWSSGGNSELTGYSTNTVNAFREWLKKHYNDNLSALRGSWNSPAVTFETAQVPTAAMRKANSGSRTFRNSQTEQNVIDWYQFYNQIVPETMDYFAGRIKTRTVGTKIVGGFYGYLKEFMGNPEFGHNALSRYYASTNLDFIYVTASYGNLDKPAANAALGIPGNYQRGLGGADYPRGADTSARLHGKLWYNNNDMATVLAPARMQALGYSPQGIIDGLIMRGYTTNLTQNRWMMRRHAGMVACGGMYEDWFDIDGGYYNSPDLMVEVGLLNGFAARTAIHDRSSVSQILVVTDELSCNHSTFNSWDNPLLNSALYAPPAQLAKLGAPIDNVLLDDLTIIDPAPYKMIVFLNCFHMSNAQRQAVDNFKQGGRTLVFCYAPGYFNHTNAANANMASLTGINIQAAASETLVTQRIQLFNNPESAVQPLVAALSQSGYTNFGPSRVTGKRFNVVDASAYSLGTEPSSANVRMAYKNQGNWQSIYSATADMPDGIWRALASYAGVHIYNNSNDTLYANASYLCLHANGAGLRTITFPQNGTIYDALTENVIAAGTNQVTQVLQNGQTLILRLSTIVPMISIVSEGVQPKITFTGTLLWADAVTGPWTDVPNATSPFNVSTTINSMKFYRTRQ